jgi:hypothetical protein
VNRAEFIAALEPGTTVRVHDHFVGVLLTYKVVWRRRATVCLKLADQRHITTRIVYIPERRYVIEQPATMHLLDRRETPTLSITIAA